MCVVSNVGDRYGDTFPQRWPGIYPYVPPGPYVPEKPIVWPPQVTQEDLAKLRQELEDLKLLLVAAKKQDEEEGNADCEQAEKVALLRKLADAVGLGDTFDEIFGSAQ